MWNECSQDRKATKAFAESGELRAPTMGCEGARARDGSGGAIAENVLAKLARWMGCFAGRRLNVNAIKDRGEVHDNQVGHKIKKRESGM